MKQTALTYLIDKLELKVLSKHLPFVDNIISEALEMEHEQMEFFFKQGHLNSGCPYALEEVYLKRFEDESNA